jgi:hypothetical protein
MYSKNEGIFITVTGTEPEPRARIWFRFRFFLGQNDTVPAVPVLQNWYKGLSVSIQIFLSDLTIKTPPTEQWEESGGV